VRQQLMQVVVVMLTFVKELVVEIHELVQLCVLEQNKKSHHFLEVYSMAMRD